MCTCTGSMFTCVPMYVETTGHWLLFLRSQPYCFLRHGLLLAWNLLIQLYLLANNSQEFMPLPTTLGLETCTATLVFFTWIPAKVLVLVCQTLFHLSCLPVTIFHIHPFFHVFIFISFKFKDFILGSSLTPKVTFHIFITSYSNITI